MKSMILLAGITTILVSACSTSAKEEKYVPKDGTINTTVAPVSTPTTQETVVNPQQMVNTTATPVQIQPQTQQMPLNMGTVSGQKPVNATPMMTQSQPQAVTSPTPTAAGMNPAHGQPGHRCDINVGAPLNSKPAPAPVVAQQQPVQANMTQQPAVSAGPTAPGMNPPHGQPGHRCDITVGAPLNSAPAKKDSGL